MKRAIIVVTIGVFPVSMALADNYTIDPGHTYPSFTINHLGFSTMAGKFDSTTGAFTYDPAGKSASVEVTIDASSIDTGHDKRDDHLRSPDFLNVAEFPEITFKSTNVGWGGEAPSSIDGDLTILGVTQPVSLAVTGVNCGEHPFSKKWTCGFDANTTVKRSDFGVNYGLPAIGDELTLHFEVEGQKDE